MVREQRNTGIDLLRTVSMLMIVIHHVLLHGGILSHADQRSIHYLIAWFLEISGFCTVNVYGMISGYVGYGHKHRLSRFLQLYFQVIFYTVLSTVIFHFIRPEMVTEETVLHATFPFAFDMYWYYTAYFCLFFLMPFLDRLMDSLNRDEAKRLMLVLFVVFCVLQLVFKRQFTMTNDGYSFLWLALLYLAGAYIKKFDLGRGYGKSHLIGYFLCVLFMWFLKMGYERIFYAWKHEQWSSERLVNYTSPFVVLCAVCLIVAFKEMKSGELLKKITGFLAPVSFDVYLFHDEPLVRTAFIVGAFNSLLFKHPVIMLLSVIGTAVVIWFAGSMIGRVRILIFKFLRVGRGCEWVEAQCRKFSIW